jgi:hypothetical protein
VAAKLNLLMILAEKMARKKTFGFSDGARLAG